MKQSLTILLLLSIISVTFFGFTVMHQPESAHTTHGKTSGIRCLASTFNTTAPCPESDVLGFVGFHMNAFKTFSLATLLGAFLVAIAFLLVTVVPPFGNLGPQLVYATSYQLPIIGSFSSQLQWRWYARHQNSPTVF